MILSFRLWPLFLFIGLCSLIACVHQPPADYGYGQAGVQLEVRPGVVQRIRAVTVGGGSTGGGAAAGATAGAIVGSGVGEGSGTAAAIVAGSILGALVGDSIERDSNTAHADELTILLGDDRTVVVVQPRVGPPFQPGDPVEVLTAPDGSSRVRHYQER